MKKFMKMGRADITHFCEFIYAQSTGFYFVIDFQKNLLPADKFYFLTVYFTVFLNFLK